MIFLTGVFFGFCLCFAAFLWCGFLDEHDAVVDYYIRQLDDCRRINRNLAEGLKARKARRRR